jgi:hypothetical protein
LKPTFWDYLQVPFSRVKLFKKKTGNVKYSFIMGEAWPEIGGGQGRGKNKPSAYG